MKCDVTLGEIVKIRDLAKELKVSTTPIREALILLEQKNLVTIIPKTGVYINDINILQFKDVAELRLLLIKYVARLSTQRITEEELS